MTQLIQPYNPELVARIGESLMGSALQSQDQQFRQQLALLAEERANRRLSLDEENLSFRRELAESKERRDQELFEQRQMTRASLGEINKVRARSLYNRFNNPSLTQTQNAMEVHPFSSTGRVFQPEEEAVLAEMFAKAPPEAQEELLGFYEREGQRRIEESANAVLGSSMRVGVEDGWLDEATAQNISAGLEKGKLDVKEAIKMMRQEQQAYAVREGTKATIEDIKGIINTWKQERPAGISEVEWAQRIRMANTAIAYYSSAPDAFDLEDVMDGLQELFLRPGFERMQEARRLSEYPDEFEAKLRSMENLKPQGDVNGGGSGGALFQKDLPPPRVSKRSARFLDLPALQEAAEGLPDPGSVAPEDFAKAVKKALEKVGLKNTRENVSALRELLSRE